MDGGQIAFAAMLAAGLAASTGLRAFIGPLAASLLVLSGHLDPGPGLEWLGEPVTAGIFAAAALLEIIADKFPGVDHALDQAGLVVKPLMGVLVALSLFGELQPVAQYAIAIIEGGGVALGVQLAKSQLRLATTFFTGGIANPLVSLLEDIGTVLWTILSILAPLVAAVLLVLGGGWAVRTISRWRRNRGKPAELA
jgi:hypothetical protein